MVINDFSTIGEVLQSLSGTWALSTTDDWKCVELGRVRFYKKLVNGNSPLPANFIDRRTEITPYLVFKKENISGGVITLQDTAVKADGLVMIIQF